MSPFSPLPIQVTCVLTSSKLGLVHSNFRIFYRPVKATAQDGSKLPNIGLYEAAAGTDWKREEPNATLRNLSPATQMSVKTRQMTLRQEESQFSGIGPDFVLRKGFFVDIRNWGLRRGRSGIRQKAMPKTGPTKTSGCFDSGNLDAQFFHRLEKRLRIRQVFGKHRGSNALAFPVTASVASVQHILHCKPNTARVSGNS